MSWTAAPPSNQLDVDGGVIQDARRRQRRHRYLAACMVMMMLLVLVIVVGGGVGGVGGQAVTSQQAPAVTLNVKAMRVVRVPAGAVDLAAGDGSVWVVGFGSVTRLNATTGRVVTTIPTPRTNDFSHVAVGAGAVWVAGLGVVYRIDPRTDRVAARVRFGNSAGFGIAVGAGRVWVAVPRGQSGVVVVIDPSTDDLDGPPISVGPGPGQISYGAGAVWVENTSPPSTMRIDPATRHLSVAPAIYALGEPATTSVLAAYASLWDAGADSLSRFDPRSGNVIAQVRLARAQQVATGHGGLWVLAEPSSRTSSVFTPVKGTARVWEVDPRTNRIIGPSARLAALEPIGLAVTSDAVWVADYSSGTVTRIPLRA
jgi:DNA-binding beta-propeller fold protein YncE